MLKNVLILLSLILNLVLGIFYIFFHVFMYTPGHSGYLGDTIGGLTAPFINGLSIFIIYIAFRDQRAVPFFMQFSDRIEDLTDDCKRLEYHHYNDPLQPNPIIIRGMESLSLYNQYRANGTFGPNVSWTQYDALYVEQVLVIHKKQAIYTLDIPHSIKD
jgi:hypothetical protein